MKKHKYLEKLKRVDWRRVKRKTLKFIMKLASILKIVFMVVFLSLLGSGHFFLEMACGGLSCLCYTIEALIWNHS